MFSLRLVPSRFRRCLRAGVLLCCAGLLLSVTPLRAQLPQRLKAPDFDGAVGPTLGSDKPLKLKELRGKIVVLEFWTLC